MRRRAGCRWTSTAPDVDGDSDLDVVVGNSSYARQNRLYLNFLHQLDAPYLLRIGYDFQLDVHARYGPASQMDLAFPVIATAPAHVPLPTFGTLGIDLATVVAIPSMVVVSQPAGVGSLSLRVPSNPGLVGMQAYAQALLFQPGKVSLTNVSHDVVRRL